MAISDDLHVVDAPAEPGAPIVVVVHGAMDRASSFGRVARGLRDLHVVRYDRRGYGKSIGGGAAPLEQHVADLEAVLAGRRAVVFGHSMGAVVALVAAARHRDIVRSVLAFEPPTPWEPWWPGSRHTPGADPAAEAEAFMIRAVGERIWQRLPARTRADRRAEGLALQADLASLGTGRPFDPADIAVPVVVAYGSETSWWHDRASRALADQLPDAELQAVEGATHGAHLSHPAAVVELVRRTLSWADLAESHRPRGPGSPHR
jgi:pimeloyl-ACP methyl ester carboxylesterase